MRLVGGGLSKMVEYWPHKHVGEGRLAPKQVGENPATPPHMMHSDSLNIGQHKWVNCLRGHLVFLGHNSDCYSCHWRAAHFL